MVRLINCDTYDYEEFETSRFIDVDDDGYIIKVGRMNEIHENPENTVDMKGKLVLPGFVVSHTHVYSTFARGVKLPFHPNSFKDILEQLWWKLDSKLDLESIYYSGLIGGIEFVRNGITTVVDHHASGKIRGSLRTLEKAIVEDIGLRGIFCFETSDRFNVDEAIDENLEFLGRRSEKSAGMFGLHASLSLSDETLKRVSDLLDGHPIHVHVAESVEDEEDSLKKYGKRVVERFEDFGLLTDRSILAHCVHLNEDELNILSKKDVFVAFNVSSNMNNGVGLPDYSKFKGRKIKIVVGNDGLGYGVFRDYMNLFFTQRYLKRDPKAFTFEDVMEIIDNSYDLVERILGIKVGRIKKGYKADLVAFEYDEFTKMDEENVFSHIFFGVFDSPRISDVMVDGKFIMKDGKIIPLDERKVFEEALKVSRNLWKRLME